MAVAYNTRPGRNTAYKNGKKRPLGIRILMGLFPVKGDNAFEICRKLIFIGAFCAFMYYGSDVIYKTVNEVVSDIATKNLLDKIGGEFDLNDPDIQKILKEKPEMLSEFVPLYNLNDDFVGHFRLGNETDGYIIDYPVYKHDENNEYYLKHTPEGNYSDGGSIFADYRNKFTPDGLSGNTILYGHNFTLGTYFSKLTRYYTGNDSKRFVGDDLDFYREHPTLTFNTLYDRSEWKIFACIFANTDETKGEVFDYVNVLNFSDADSFNNFILQVMDMSVFFTDVNLTYGDNILTLSTCYFPFGGEYTRCAVFARKVREGESAEVNVDKAVPNTAEYRWTAQRNIWGTNWNGRTWNTSYLLSYEE